MKNNQVPALLFVSAMVLAALLLLAMYAQKMEYRDLMLVVPHNYGISAYDIKGIDKISDEGIAVTCEVRSAAAAEAVNARRYPVTRIGTNSSYCQLMGLQILEGSFFMEAAVRTGTRYAVLSSTAADQLFGSRNIIGNTFMLDGEAFLVTGVVKDEIQKEAMVYVPSGTALAPVQALLVKTGAAPEAAGASLLLLGVDEAGSRIIDLYAVSSSFWQQFLAGVCLWAAFLLMLPTYRRIDVIRRDVTVLKIRGQRMYCYELIAASRQELLRIVRQTVALLACSVIVLHLLRKILEMILGWKEMFNQYKLLSDTLFTGKVQWLVRYFYCGPLLFICFIVLLSIAAGLYRAGERNH